jgi:hypothetical protein
MNQGEESSWEWSATDEKRCKDIRAMGQKHWKYQPNTTNYYLETKDVVGEGMVS